MHEKRHVEHPQNTLLGGLGKLAHFQETLLNRPHEQNPKYMATWKLTILV